MISKSKTGRDQRQKLWGAQPGAVRGHGPAHTWGVDFHSSGMGGKMLPHLT